MELYSAEVDSTERAQQFQSKEIELVELLSNYRKPTTWQRFNWNRARVLQNFNLDVFPLEALDPMTEQGEFEGALFDWDDQKPSPIFDNWAEFIILLRQQ